MEVPIRLEELVLYHPRLLWADIIAATASVIADSGNRSAIRLACQVQDIPSFGSGEFDIIVDAAGTTMLQLDKIRRTLEPHRRVELAGIALAGLALYHAGGHEIRDVAVRGSAADYLVDEENHLLEIAARSRRADLSAAWEQRWQRLLQRRQTGFYVCAVELESTFLRLQFQP